MRFPSLVLSWFWLLLAGVTVNGDFSNPTIFDMAGFAAPVDFLE
jgi:hypothetical protein